MKFKDLSTTFHTHKIQECKDFYVKYLGAKVTFDCDWYVSVQFASDVNPYIFLSFMAPRDENTLIANGGVTLNLLVDDVEAEYQKMQASDAQIVDPIADHDWGDRSFTIHDPLENVLYIYSPRELSEEYKKAVIK